jgi:hypothetical protein
MANYIENQMQQAIYLYTLLDEGSLLYSNTSSIDDWNKYIQEIKDTIAQIDDLKRWNITDTFNNRLADSITDMKYQEDTDNIFDFIDDIIIDVENPAEYFMITNDGCKHPCKKDYGYTPLDYIIANIIDYPLENNQEIFSKCPRLDEIIEILVLNESKCSTTTYYNWLKLSNMYYNTNGEPINHLNVIHKYESVKKYLRYSIATTILGYSFAITIQKRVRGNQSRLFNSDCPTRYMRNLPTLKISVWKRIKIGFQHDEIESDEIEYFKTEIFDPKWFSDSEIETNRLIALYLQ